MPILDALTTHRIGLPLLGPASVRTDAIITLPESEAPLDPETLPVQGATAWHWKA